MKPRYSGLKYLAITFAGGIGILCSVLAINLIIDPYGTSPVGVSIEGVNAIRTERRAVDRLVKPFDFLQRQPKTVIFGNSRVKEGFDVSFFDNTVFAPAYNFGVDKTGLLYVNAVLDRLAGLNERLETVFIEVFPYYFFGPTESPAITLSSLAADVASMTISWSALAASLRTITLNRSYTDNVAFLHPNGVVEMWDTNFVSDLGQFVRHTAGHIAKGPVKMGERHREMVRRIRTLCALYAKRCVLFMAPIHPVYLSVDFLDNRWERFEEMKRILAENGGYIDFTRLNVYTQEPPGPETSYWFDINHFNRHVGNLVLGKLAGKTISGLPDNFGVYVNSSNVDSHLAAWKNDMSDWVAANLEFVDRLRRGE